MAGFLYNGVPIEDYAAIEKTSMLKERDPAKVVLYPNYKYNGTAVELPYIGSATSGYFTYGNKIKTPKKMRMPSPSLWLSLYNLTIENTTAYDGRIIYDADQNVFVELKDSNGTLVNTLKLMPNNGLAPKKLICEMVGNGGAIWGGMMGHGYSPGYGAAYICLELDLEVAGSNFTFNLGGTYGNVSLTYNGSTATAGSASPSYTASSQGSPGYPNVSNIGNWGAAGKVLAYTYGQGPCPSNDNRYSNSVSILHEYFPVTKTVEWYPNSSPYTEYRSGGLTPLYYGDADAAYGFKSYGKGADCNGSNYGAVQTNGCFRLIY